MRRTIRWRGLRPSRRRGWTGEQLRRLRQGAGDPPRGGSLPARAGRGRGDWPPSSTPSRTLKRALRSGPASPCLPAPTIRLEVRAGTLKSVPLAGCRFVRPLGVIRRRQHKLGGAALHFLELLREAGDHGERRPMAAGQRQGPLLQRQAAGCRKEALT